MIDFAEKTEGYDYLSIQGNESQNRTKQCFVKFFGQQNKDSFERTGALKDGQISEKTLRNYFNEAKIG